MEELRNRVYIHVNRGVIGGLVSFNLWQQRASGSIPVLFEDCGYGCLKRN